MASTTRQQPPWQPPEEPPADAGLPPIRIYNSLTRSKVPFHPLDWKGRTISWYACGPTVYDASHIGHARNYVSTDIIRRILTLYFKFKVKFVMNITDVDDKIIVRGRQQHLLEEFYNHRLQLKESEIEVRLLALKAYILKNLPKIPDDTSPDKVAAEAKKQYAAVLDGGSLNGGVAGDDEAKMKMHIKTISAASSAIIAHRDSAKVSPEDQASLDDLLMAWLDPKFSSAIDASNHGLWTKLTKKYEDLFFQDMRDLDVLDPDEITRVTEYGPQIADFVAQIEKNRLAYRTTDSSVYFDTQAFEKAGFNYARLEPWNRHDTKLQADGEGALTKNPSEKRSPADFALWKSSKSGEPAWNSPWGSGRPGWHIECSAMASDRLGSTIDIHSGGIDLAFPHHDNELAQSEAYYHEHKQWINYFIHFGHLSIQGAKMSKSLKNFTTIREALSRGDWTSRSLRIVFLLGGWREGIEITDDLVKAGSSWEQKITNFFLNAKDLLERETSMKQESTDEALVKALQKADMSTFDALCDSFNTPTVMSAISELLSKYNSTDQPQADITRQITEWVTEMVTIFGLNGRSSSLTSDKQIGWSGIDVPADALPVLRQISTMRDTLRQKARSPAGIKHSDVQAILLRSLQEAPYSEEPSNTTINTANSTPFTDLFTNFKNDLSFLTPSSNLSKEILTLCDRLRDTDLFPHGIYLEDREQGPALIRLVTPEQRAARVAKSEAEKQKAAAKAEREAEAKMKEDQARVKPQDMFRTEEWSAWDEDGVPIRDREGVEVTKSRGKKLRKEWERQRKAFEGLGLGKGEGGK